MKKIAINLKVKKWEERESYSNCKKKYVNF